MEAQNEAPADAFRPGDVVLHRSTMYDEDPQGWVIARAEGDILTCRAWNPAAFKTFEEKFERCEVVKYDDRPTAAVAFGEAVGYVLRKLGGEGRYQEQAELKKSAAGFFAAVEQALHDAK